MDALDFTAGITFHDDRVVTVDVTAIGADGITYRADQGPETVPWADVKAVMLATTDHMLESAGSLFAMAERLQAGGDEGAPAAREMRSFGLGILQQVAPRACPLGEGCGLRPGGRPSGQGGGPPAG
ncbi:MAG TPA: hypothetical protein VM263_02200 [Acidimicrobiales bacterium]|nr:hypothetical protein [Acidimicrobiales bacterium]